MDIGSNRRLAAGMLLAEFKMPWRDLAETSVRARAFGAGEVNLSSNSEWWTYRESNSDPCNLPPHFKFYLYIKKGKWLNISRMRAEKILDSKIRELEPYKD